MASLPSLLTARRPVVMDGAAGTMLLPLGLDAVERAVLRHPRAVRDLHAAYARAGASVVLTCTFQSNPAALARVGLEGQLEAINAAAVRLAREGAPGAAVLGDVGPLLTPGGTEEFADRAALRRVLASLEGADGVLFETCSSPAALAAAEYALHRAPEVEGLPLLVSLTYRRDAAGRLVTHSGHGPETYARRAARHGVAALGVNCGRDVGLAEVADILGSYRGETDLPLFARPNAGSPGQGGAYPLTPEALAAAAPGLAAAMVGGCCGTTPAHVAAVAAALSEPRPSRAAE